MGLGSKEGNGNAPGRREKERKEARCAPGRKSALGRILRVTRKFLDLSARYKGMWLLCENLPTCTFMMCTCMYVYFNL